MSRLLAGQRASSVVSLVCLSSLHGSASAHLLTCSQAHLLTNSPAHKLTCSQAHLLTNSPAHKLTCSQAHLLTSSPAHLVPIKTCHYNSRQCDKKSTSSIRFLYRSTLVTSLRLLFYPSRWLLLLLSLLLAFLSVSFHSSSCMHATFMTEHLLFSSYD